MAYTRSPMGAIVFNHTFSTTQSRSEVIETIKRNADAAKSASTGWYVFRISDPYHGKPSVDVVAGVNVTYSFYFDITETGGKTIVRVTSSHDYSDKGYKKMYDHVLRMLAGTGCVDTNTDSFLSRPENSRIQTWVITAIVLVVLFLIALITH